jgi:hypothetical protein
MSLMRIVRLAQSSSSKRGRIYAQLAYGDPHVGTLTSTISRLRVASYKQQLSEMAGQAGLSAAKTLEPAVTRTLARASAQAAAGVVKTHNRDLRAFLSAQPRTLSQADLGKAARAWERQRVSVKSKQIAQNEAARARSQAFRDVLDRNGVKLRVRAVPEEAAEEECLALVDRGWIASDDAPDLPLHINCQHEYEDEGLADALSGKEQVWLGGMVAGPTDSGGKSAA